ncbi:MAG: CDP-diacylglycerol--serine O-phosphatidyltransferase [Bdellovibrionales bacterium GWB1_55_8]|nr:MAG: CDP-diacylglycerol--serine O-phosphatidyltransferase [Bdellovibrionales bacterium GWB1_55_8]
MRKIYIVPNFVTTANMFSGFYSIIASIHGDYIAAAWAILAAAVFDLLDGRIARMARATSAFGVQYDSLSDLISFGVAPGILLHQWSLEPFGRLGWIAAFLFVACGALRLARFNVTTGVIPKGYFQGLPIPMAAGLVATFIIFSRTIGWDASDHLVVLAIAFGLAGLMVSTVPFPSFKELNWRSRASFGFLMIGVISMILIAMKPEVTLFLVLVGYLAGSLLWNLWRLVTGRHLPAPEH